MLHKELTPEKWQKLSFFKQMANIGAEIGRTIKWREKDKNSSNCAFDRGLELLDLTIEDPKNKSELEELYRVREGLVDYFHFKKEYSSKTDELITPPPSKEVFNMKKRSPACWPASTRRLQRGEPSHIKMNISRFEDVLQSLAEGRRLFLKNADPLKHDLKQVFDLYFSVFELTKKVTTETDEELIIIETLSMATRRIISSFVLLESGFQQEARILLRNFIEYILISIDITYNKNSLDNWKGTINDNLFDDSRDYTYFKARIINKRIQKNKNNIYPNEEMINANYAYKEWIKISNQVLHANARAQTQNIIKGNNIELMGWFSSDDYKKILNTYCELILSLIQQLIFIPKYKEKISNSQDLKLTANMIATQFQNLQNKYGGRR